MSSTPGLLRLKGSQTTTSSAKISKPKIKKKKPRTETSTGTQPDPSTDSSVLQQAKDMHLTTEQEQAADTAVHHNEPEVAATAGAAAETEEDIPPSSIHKTEAELRYEESKRRRLNHRLKREGTKTHKERVEELNRYLSGLSEHHDMPRIGPG